MSVLYVDAVGMPARIRLDGPALALERPEGPRGRMPLRRLSRVVVRGPAALETGVLATLLHRGIPLTVLAGDGRLLGLCLPAHARRTDTRALLEEAELRGRLEAVRATWPAAEERRLVLDLRTTLGLPLTDLRRRRVDRRLHTLLDAAGGPPAEDLLRWGASLLDAHLARRLWEEGLGRAWQGADPERWNLRETLGHILILALVPTLLELARFEAERGRPDDDRRLYRRLARRYEREAGRLERLMDGMLARLRRRLREELEG